MTITRWAGHGTTMLGLAFVLACGATNPEVTEPTTEASPDRGSRPSTLSLEAEIGALDERAVTAAFNDSIDGMMKCFKKGIERVPYLAGVVRISVRVPAEGSVRPFMKSSTLGDRVTEACMLEAIEKRSWPAPVGGKVGLAENEFTFDPQEGTREPVEWNRSDAGDSVDQALEELRRCGKHASGATLSATLYVETDGSVASVGVAGNDPSVEGAADCVVDAMKALKFNSPGSFAAKLTLNE